MASAAGLVTLDPCPKQLSLFENASGVVETQWHGEGLDNIFDSTVPGLPDSCHDRVRPFTSKEDTPLSSIVFKGSWADVNCLQGLTCHRMS